MFKKNWFVMSPYISRFLIVAENYFYFHKTTTNIKGKLFLKIGIPASSTKTIFKTDVYTGFEMTH